MYEYPNKSKPTRTTLHEVFSGLSNSSAINNRETVLHIRPAVSETEGIFADFSPWSGLCHIWVKSIHAVLFSLYISCIWWSLSAVFAAGRKSNGRFAFKQLGRFIASPPRFTFLFLARQTGAFPFPLRPSYDKVLCGLYVAMYYSTFLLFIYLFILTADGFKPPLSNNPPHRQYRKMLPQQRWKQHKSPYFKPFSAHFRKWACIKDGF